MAPCLVDQRFGQFPSDEEQAAKRGQRDEMRTVLGESWQRVFTQPNWRLITLNGCSTFARTMATALRLYGCGMRQRGESRD